MGCNAVSLLRLCQQQIQSLHVLWLVQRQRPWQPHHDRLQGMLLLLLLHQHRQQSSLLLLLLLLLLQTTA
jgi:hypothetical protein